MIDRHHFSSFSTKNDYPKSLKNKMSFVFFLKSSYYTINEKYKIKNDNCSMEHQKFDLLLLLVFKLSFFIFYATATGCSLWKMSVLVNAYKSVTWHWHLVEASFDANTDFLMSFQNLRIVQGCNLKQSN
ncbi:hypothetical protein AMTRI_Chr04g245820 [Amborella trichopoda]